MSFSQRYGYREVNKVIQTESINEPLRNGLWNILTDFVWINANASIPLSFSRAMNALCIAIWADYFKETTDQLNSSWKNVYTQIRQYYFNCEWHEIYDFLEFIANNYQWDNLEVFIRKCNQILERETSAYRFIDGVITRITSPTQIVAIENALKHADEPVQVHLHRALELLSDRESPDYRNSIKESISAVECLVGRTLGEKGTLGQLIKKMEDEIGLHPTLKEAFSKLYGYTNDAGGIRHAIFDSTNLSQADAVFFLVICAAFINFVEAKKLIYVRTT